MINGGLKVARQYYQQRAIPMAAFDQNLERMYPGIPQHRVKPAWKALLKMFKQFLLIHRPTQIQIHGPPVLSIGGKGQKQAVGLPRAAIRKVF